MKRKTIIGFFVIAALFSSGCVSEIQNIEQELFGRGQVHTATYMEPSDDSRVAGLFETARDGTVNVWENPRTGYQYKAVIIKSEYMGREKWRRMELVTMDGYGYAQRINVTGKSKARGSWTVAADRKAQDIGTRARFDLAPREPPVAKARSVSKNKRGPTKKELAKPFEVTFTPKEEPEKTRGPEPDDGLADIFN